MVYDIRIIMKRPAPGFVLISPKSGKKGGGQNEGLNARVTSPWLSRHFQRPKAGGTGGA
jgi:hypothetical protein